MLPCPPQEVLPTFAHLELGASPNEKAREVSGWRSGLNAASHIFRSGGDHRLRDGWMGYDQNFGESARCYGVSIKQGSQF